MAPRPPTLSGRQSTTGCVRRADTSPTASSTWRAPCRPRTCPTSLHRRPVTRPCAGWLTGRILRGCGAELAAGACIGPGLRLRHTTGLVVGDQVVAGRDLTLHQGVTLRDRVPGEGQPLIRDRVYIAA